MKILYIVTILFIVFSIFILSQVNSLIEDRKRYGLVILENSDTCYVIDHQKYIFSWENLLPFEDFSEFSTVNMKIQNCSGYLLGSDSYYRSLIEKPIDNDIYESIIYYTPESFNIETKFGKYIDSYKNEYPERKEFVRNIYIIILNFGSFDLPKPIIEKQLQRALLIRYEQHFSRFIFDHFNK